MIQLNNLPLPPSTNALYSNAGKKRVKSPKYRQFINECKKWALFNQRDLIQGRGLIKEMGLLKFTVELYQLQSDLFCKDGTPKKNDASNRIKAIEDVSFNFLHHDDKFVFHPQAIQYVATERYCNVIIERYSHGS